VLTAAFICLLIALSLFLLYRNSKIENLTKERIAQDLHDEAGTTLTKMLMSVNASPELPDKGQIKAGLNDALYSIRAFIDSMRAEKPGLRDFEDDLREHLANIAKGSALQFSFRVEGKDVRLRQELYRDMKLCLHDVITEMLHAGLSKIDIHIVLIARQLKITVKDNGIEEKTVIYKLSEEGGSNFKKRTERHKGSFSISKNAERDFVWQLVFEV
jgi:signal transduction histidine kinase